MKDAGGGGGGGGGGGSAAEYRALPLRAPGASYTRYLFIRRHRCEPGGDEHLAERTLFVAALPACFCERRLTALFESFAGPVESVTLVTLASLPVPGARVVFSAAKAVNKALRAAQPGAPPQPLPPRDPATLTGLARWVAEYRSARPGLSELQHKVDGWVAAWEAEQERAARARAAAAAADDGWTVVKSKKRKASER